MFELHRWVSPLARLSTLQARQSCFRCEVPDVWCYTARYLLYQHSRAVGRPPVIYTAARLLHTTLSDLDDRVIGGYTPITKQLWLERLQASEPLQPDIGQRNRRPFEQRDISEITYHFSSDTILREMYRNPWGFMRIGRLLEDLDSLAGNIAFNHCRPPSPSLPAPLLVTASVDNIRLAHSLSIEKDVRICGQVVWTGKSSLDIRMQLLQERYDSTPSLTALFSFVHLDPVTRKAAPIRQLQPQTQEEQRLFSERQQLADTRRALRQSKAPEGHTEVPAEAKEWMAPLLAQARLMQELPSLMASSSAVLMPATCLQNTFVCQPQQKNLRGRVFGGFLMRRAYELGFATTYMFAGTRPIFVCVDEITFSKPVDVGDLLRFKSTVVHSQRTPGKQQSRLVVEVEARVTKAEELASYTTNTFTFIFDVEPGSHGAVKAVLPTCEEEGLRAWRGMQAAQQP